MKPDLLTLLKCPTCSGELNASTDESGLVCQQCGQMTRMQTGVPLFTVPPVQMVPSEKIARGPQIGTWMWVPGAVILPTCSTYAITWRWMSIPTRRWISFAI
ncbi:MAG: hypothetical protein H6Q38_687 [Chloroflexi bacterium]|nr:hypothetical protein [Chloroflexota bacterium]